MALVVLNGVGSTDITGLVAPDVQIRYIECPYLSWYTRTAYWRKVTRRREYQTAHETEPSRHIHRGQSRHEPAIATVE